MKKEIKDITAAFFEDEPKEEAARAEAAKDNGADQDEPKTPRTADKSRRVVKEAKSARLNLLIRPHYKEALKDIAKSHKQSVNDLINDLIEKYVDDEEIKAERKKK